MPSSGPVVVGQKGNLVKSTLALAALVSLDFKELDLGVDAKKGWKIVSYIGFLMMKRNSRIWG